MPNFFLAIRTDNPEAELHLLDRVKVIHKITWHAHRQLSDTLLIKIDELFDEKQLSKKQLSGIIVYRGPGSFTGLRIGIAVANALSFSLNIPITGEMGGDWQSIGLKSILNVPKKQIITPEYGGEAVVTKPRK